MATDLRLTIAKQRDTFALTLGGELDLANSDDLINAARLALSSKPCESLTIDLGEVTFVDSTGLSALIVIYNECKEQSALLSLVNVPASVSALVGLAGLDGELPIV